MISASSHRVVAYSIEPLEARIAPAAVAAINLSSLDGKTGFKLSGVADSDGAGFSVSDAGDVNGDGFADVIIGASGADEGGAGANRGASYVVFGKAGGFAASTPLSTLDGTNGFKLSGVADGDQSGFSVSGAGDVNGDGFADLIVGASSAAEGGTHRGASYVVFGKADFSATGGSLNLLVLDGISGFKLSGVADGDNAGYSVSGAGDVNGDGFADVIIGAPQAAAGGTSRGASYVVFGKAGGFAATLALSALDGSNGFKLSGATDFENAGHSVSAAGDVNGDGFADFIIGAENAAAGGTSRGASYVVFGKAGGFGASVAFSALDGTNGFKLTGVANLDLSGFSLSAAGDVNGDGFGDLIIGAYHASEGGTNRGASYVVFGKAGGFGASLALSALDGTNGFKLRGVVDGDQIGRSVSAAGDVNGDGFADIIIGAPFAAEGGFHRGASYVVFGKADFSATAGSLNLSTLDGTNGFKLSPTEDNAEAGSVSAAGDVNGDGFGDLLIGAFGLEGGTGRGGSYVVFGFGTADVTVALGNKSATFTDWDGDLVTIKTSAGMLDAKQFHLSSPNPLTGGAHLIDADFTAAGFAKANLTFTAKRGPTGGDGLVNVGTLDARGVVLGKVSVDGDLQQLDAAGAAGLTVYSLGDFAAAGVHGAPLTSQIDGTLGALTVKTDVNHVTLAATAFGAIKAASLDGVKIFAAGFGNPATAAAALVIKSLTIGGNVRDTHILAGYDATGAAANADVQIGAVKVLGNWIASDLVAGVRAGDDGIFATGDTNEKLITGGNAIVAKIASITIGGAAFGTVNNLRDGFGFAAEEIGSLMIGKAKVPLLKGANNDTMPLLVGLTGDVRVREVAA